MHKTKHFTLYSHGFGVDKTGRGLLTDIAASLPDSEPILFDYNNYDTDGNMTVSPVLKEVEKLEQHLSKLPEDAVVDIIAHSQGCIIAALAKLPQNIRKIVLVAPPLSFSSERRISHFKGREGAVINLDGQSRVPRRDGTMTFIPADFWNSLDNIDVVEALKKLASKHDLTIIKAVGDEIIGDINLDDLAKTSTIIKISADHNFTGDARGQLCKEIVNVL